MALNSPFIKSIPVEKNDLYFSEVSPVLFNLIDKVIRDSHS